MGKGQNNIVDIQLATSSKKKFRIDGDDNRIIELDVTDLSILNRLRECYPKLNSLAIKGFDMNDEAGEDALTAFDNVMLALNNVDKEMRELLNYLFDSDIADLCSPEPLYNMCNGEFRFEHVLNVLFTLYTDNIQAEFNKMTARMSAHTQKYTGK